MEFYRNRDGYWIATESLETVLEHRFKHIIFVQNQEEKDYFSRMQLMFGKTADIITLDEWKQRKRMYQVTTHYKRTEAPLKLPYTVFTPFDIIYAKFD